MMNAGETYGIKKITGDDAAKRHLEEMGFVPGANVLVVSTSPDGNLIVNVKGARLALNAGLARRIFV
jgi:ferrous iron transport protein A